MKRKYIEPELEIIKLTLSNVLNTSLKENPADDIYQDAENSDFEWEL